MNPESPEFPPMNRSYAPEDVSALPPLDSPPRASGRLANGAILRLLDANANRAREALRVLEDYARFVIDSTSLSGRLKELRHGLADAVGPILPEAILHRDTPGDVGTANKTVAELTRTNVNDVVVAAGKRLGEALRAIEEYLKTSDPAAAQQVESLRYTSYDLEQRIARTLRPPACDFSAVQLYVLITESVCKGNWLDAATDALMGGADCLQLREKSLESGELLSRAKQLVALCREFGVLCIINDRPDIAVLSGADGVHVGQEDLPAVEARKIVGPNRIVGVSTHNIEQAKQAVLDGADYIGVGPFFRSSTKPRDFIAGPEYAKEVAEQIKISAVAIAGITEENVDEVFATGIKAIAVSSAVLAADDIKLATAQLKIRFPPGPSPQTGGNPGGRTFLSVTRDQKERSNTDSGRDSSPTPRPKPLAEAPPSTTPPPISTPSGARQPGELSTFTRRNLPHVMIKGATYFITFRLVIHDLDKGERKIILDHLQSGNSRFYRLVGAVIMPDHVHMILEPKNDYSLPRILKGTKGVTSNLLNRRRNRVGQVWLDENWDRIIRNQNDLAEKMRYMLDNPVRKGLVADGQEWDAWYCNED